MTQALSSTSNNPPQITICRQHAKYGMRGLMLDATESVIDSITLTSTVEAFNAALQTNPQCQIEGMAYSVENSRMAVARKRNSGEHLLGAAAGKGNSLVVARILAISNKITLNVGNEDAQPPLFSACHEPNIPSNNRYQTVQVLLDAGAKVNCATGQAAGRTPDEFVPARATPLWAAVEKARDVGLALLLLARGAVLGPDNHLSSEGQSVLTKAQERLKEYETNLDLAINTSTNLIPDLRKIVAGYVGDDPPVCFEKSAPTE